jgi:hypothetical protein
MGIYCAGKPAQKKSIWAYMDREAENGMGQHLRRACPQDCGWDGGGGAGDGGRGGGGDYYSK